MGALKIIVVQTLCVCLMAVTVLGQETNVLTKAEQKTLNRASMKAAKKLERTSAKFIEAPPVKAKASRLTIADIPSVIEAIAKAGLATNEAVTVVKLTGSAKTVTEANFPVCQKIKGVVTVTAFNYVFVWKTDREFVFPDLAARRASSDSYFGGLEKQIAAACEAGDSDRAGQLVQDYVDKWDNVYKVQRQNPRGNRRGSP